MKILSAIAVFLLFLLAACLPAAVPELVEQNASAEIADTTADNTEIEAVQTQTKEGTLVIAITDKALSLGNITSVKIKVLSASAYNKEKAFWTTISDADMVVDLLELKKNSLEKVYGNKSLQEGEYSMLKLKISDVKVMRNNKEEDAFLPSGELKIQSSFRIDAEQQTKITLDFIADESLHLTGDGKIIFAPVIHVKTGKQEISIGMNEKGELGTGRIDAKKEFLIQNNKIVEKQAAQQNKQPLLPKPTTIDEKFAALHESVVEIGEGEKKTVVVEDD